MIDGKGNFTVIHQFTADEGHAASMTAGDGRKTYMAARCGRLPRCPPGLCPQGSCTGWRHRGRTFKCSTRSARRTRAARTWMAPTATSRLSKRGPASFMGRPLSGGTNGNGVVFRYSLWQPRGRRGCPRLQRLELCRPELGRGEPGWPASSRAKWDSVLERRGRRRKWQRRDLQPQGRRPLRGSAHLQCNECNHRSQ